jgi:hypothetical protein
MEGQWLIDEAYVVRVPNTDKGKHESDEFRVLVGVG